jgi:bacillithiol system protein YtxJ
MKWNHLTEKEHLETAIKNSFERPVLLFKHSTRCPISSMALSRVERSWSFTDSQLEPWFLDLIQHRNLSNQIAATTGIQHESPQVIVLKEGKVIHTASHYDIRLENILLD